jgi:hypothetical protein
LPLSDKQWSQLPPVRFHPMSRRLPRSWFQRGTRQLIL